VSSCRLLVISFVSDEGGFEETFSEFAVQQGQAASFTTGVGLFQWLRPNDADDPDSWSDGSCVGYQSTMLDVFSEPLFETARGFAVFSVLIAIVVVAWIFLMVCVAWTRFQIWIMSALLLAAGIATSMTLLMKQSALCQTTFLDRDCALDQGGLVMIAAVILWVAAFMISVVFLKPLPDDEYDDDDDDGDIYAIGLTKARQKQMAAQQSVQRSKQQKKRKQQQQERTLSPSGSGVSRRVPPLTPSTQGSFDYSYDSQDSWRSPKKKRSQQSRLTVDDVSNQQQLEVYMAERVDRISSMAEV